MKRALFLCETSVHEESAVFFYVADPARSKFLSQVSTCTSHFVEIEESIVYARLTDRYQVVPLTDKKKTESSAGDARRSNKRRRKKRRLATIITQGAFKKKLHQQPQKGGCCF